MAVWTAPRTWATGELVTASMMNQYVRDEFLWLSGGDGVSTAPPAAPTRYQRWVYLTPQSAHQVFIYRDDLDGTYPWHYLGGRPLIASTPGMSSTSATLPSWVTVGPTVSLGRAGVYDIAWQVGRVASSAGNAGTPNVLLLYNGAATYTMDGTWQQGHPGGAWTDTGTFAAGYSFSFGLGASAGSTGSSAYLEYRSVALTPFRIQ